MVILVNIVFNEIMRNGKNFMKTILQVQNRLTLAECYVMDKRNKDYNKGWFDALEWVLKEDNIVFVKKDIVPLYEKIIVSVKK